MLYSEAERLFNEDIREKKKAASGVHHKTGKKGYVGRMLFPSDIMSRKDKYNHRKAGKVVATNLYDQILTLDEFNKLEEFEKRNMLQYWRSKYTNKEIQKVMGLSNNPFYKIVNDLGLPRALRAPRTVKPRTGKVTTEVKKENKDHDLLKAFDEGFEAGLQKALEQAAIQEEELQEQLQVAAPAEPVQEILVNGIHFVYNGSFSPAHIQNQLLKFATILDGENDEFYIELKLTQKCKA